MSYIGAQQGTSSPVLLDSITVVNGQAAYTMQKDGVNYTPASTLVMQVSLNGIIQAPNSSYTINGSTITFDSALVTGDTIDYILVREPTTGTIAPIDSSVTDSKIVSMAASKLTGALPALDGSALTGVSAGKLLNSVSTPFTGTFSTNSGSWVDVTGFNVSITPSATSSKILILVNVNANSNDFFGLDLQRDGTSINIGDSSNLGNRQYASWGSLQMYGWSAEANPPFSIHIYDSPSTTSQVTYQLRTVGRYGTTTGTVYINRPNSWNNDSISGRVTASSITALEIGA